MRFQPNDLPELVEGEIRRVTCKLSGVVGVNTINSAQAESSNLGIGTVSISGTDINFLLTASRVGVHSLLVSATLSSSETVKGKVRVKVTPETCETLSDRYE